MSNFSEVSSDHLKMWASFMEQVLQIDNPYTKCIYLIIMSTIFFTSLFGNLVTCFVIYADKSMHTATNYYLFNLAAADLMLTFAILIELFDHLLYPNTRVMCLIQWFSVGCLWNNSILTMTALSIERYIAICHPLMMKSTPVWRRVVKIIAFLWTLAIIETVPEMLIVDLIRTRHSSVCFTVPSPLARILNGVLAVLTFFLPLIIMVFIYSTIIFKVNATQRKNSSNKIFNHRDHREKLTWLMLAMTVTFFVCWLPFNTVRVLICVMDINQLLNLGEWWHMVFRIINVNSWLSSVMNPILFSLMSTKFRNSLKTLWATKIKRASNNSTDSCNNAKRTGISRDDMPKSRVTFKYENTEIQYNIQL